MESCLCRFLPLMITHIEHIGMIDTNWIEHLNLIHLLRLPDELLCFLLIGEEELHLVLLVLLELCEFMLLRHHEYFFEYLFVLLLALAGEWFTALLGLLLMGIAHSLSHSKGLFWLLLKQWLVYTLNPLLLLRDLGNLLGSYYRS